MGKIVISENVSLDGVVQDPTGGEGFRHGGWFERSVDKDREAWAKLEYDEALRRRRPCCWAGEATSTSLRGGGLGPASGRTG